MSERQQTDAYRTPIGLNYTDLFGWNRHAPRDGQPFGEQGLAGEKPPLAYDEHDWAARQAGAEAVSRDTRLRPKPLTSPGSPTSVVPGPANEVWDFLSAI